jgi:hypothetical protein
MRDKIEIKKSQIPYRFSIPLHSTRFMLEIRYNGEIDLFTIGLYDGDGNLLCFEPIIYGAELFRQHYKAGIYPAMCIVPLDESGANTAVTWDNFNETVFLTIDDGGE